MERVTAAKHIREKSAWCKLFMGNDCEHRSGAAGEINKAVPYVCVKDRISKSASENLRWNRAFRTLNVCQAAALRVFFLPKMKNLY